jgi:putative ABC transport system substrate-binding protein
MFGIRRRDFLPLLGGAAALPTSVRAQQQQPKLPTIGYLSSRSAQSDASMLVAVRRGLAETGYTEGGNLTIEYRFADGQFGRLPGMLAELALRQAAVIALAGATTGLEPLIQSVRASAIPIVFNAGSDPVQTGLVASINHPGGNVTGVYSLLGELAGKNFGLLHELVPKVGNVALLQSHVSPGPSYRQVQIEATEAAARLGVQLRMFDANSDSELDAAFATLNQQRIEAVLVATNPFFMTRATRIAALAASHRVPAIYARREFADAGGLMSYGNDVRDGYRQMGNYVGRILKGDKPADLPVIQPTKYELVINLKTAKALGLEVPPLLLARADEVIE